MARGLCHDLYGEGGAFAYSGVPRGGEANNVIKGRQVWV